MKKGHLHITDRKGINSIPYSNIRRISAKRSSCIVHVETGEDILVPKSMADICKEIEDEETFIKIHRSHVINLTKVKHYHKPEKAVELASGEKLPVSKAQRPDFIKAYKQY